MDRGPTLVLLVLISHFFLVVLIPQSQVGLDTVKTLTGVDHEVE